MMNATRCCKTLQKWKRANQNKKTRMLTKGKFKTSLPMSRSNSWIHLDGLFWTWITETVLLRWFVPTYLFHIRIHSKLQLPRTFLLPRDVSVLFLQLRVIWSFFALYYSIRFPGSTVRSRIEPNPHPRKVVINFTLDNNMLRSLKALTMIYPLVLVNHPSFDDA